MPPFKGEEFRKEIQSSQPKSNGRNNNPGKGEDSEAPTGGKLQHGGKNVG